MSDNAIINLLVVDRSLTDIEFIAKTLRGAEYIVDPLHTDQESEIHNMIEYKPLDLIMVRQNETLPSVATVHKLITDSAKDIPLIAILDEQPPATMVELLRAGADNVFYLQEPEHLVVTASKELGNLQIRDHLQSYETRLKETESRSRALMDSSRDAIAYIHEGAHIYANPVYLQLFGYNSEQDLEGVTVMDMIVRKDQDKLKRTMRKCMKKGKAAAPIELTGVHSDGKEFSVIMESIPTSIDNEPCLQILIHTNTVSKAQEQEYKTLQKQNKELEKKVALFDKQIKDFSKQDDMTRLFNRRYFIDHINYACENTDTKTGAVLYILLTDYRSISERDGLEAIERLLTDLGKALKKSLSKQEIIAHFSDAVFTVYTSLSEQEEILELGQKISTTIKNHESVKDHILQEDEEPLIYTGSAIGICQLKEYHTGATQLLSHADRACEEARQAGENQVIIYRPDSKPGKRKSGEVDESKIELILDAIAGKRLSALFQPIASFQNGEEKRYKAYVQLHDGQQTPLPLQEYGPVAERQGLMGRIDKWLIDCSLEALKAKAQRNDAIPTLFVRISNNVINDKEFVGWLENSIKQLGLSAELLVIEVTEDTAQTFFKESQRFKNHIKSLGCGFAISHFGGKGNSERLLKHLIPDYVKLDIDLIEKLSRDPESRQSMVDLTEFCKEHNIQLIAAEIANAPQMANIWQYGVSLVQGDMVQEASPEMNFDFSRFGG